MFIFDDLSAVSLQELIAAQNWQSQYRLITQWGKLIQHKPELRMDVHLLRGCETLAWLNHLEVDGLHRFVFDSDSRVINGLAALLLAQVDGKKIADIKMVNFADLLAASGLEKHLTPSRNNGIHAIVSKIQSIMAN